MNGASMIGDEMEAAAWYDALKPTSLEQAKDKVIKAFFAAADLYGVTFGPITWEDVAPDSPRVTEPPKDEPGVVRAVIGSARVLASRIELKSFIEDLSDQDLADLRRATRTAFEKNGGISLTDEECDYIIESHGPDVAGMEIMKG